MPSSVNLKTCRFRDCVHKPYCNLNGEEYSGLCYSIHDDPTVFGLTNVEPITLRNAIIFVKAEIKAFKCKKVNWKTAFELWEEEENYHV